MGMIPNPIFSKPNETEREKMERVEEQLSTDDQRSKIIFGGGVLAILAFGACALAGLPQAGILLVPIGMGMVLGGGIELLLGRLGS
jgi:predicted phage tail protein